MDLVSIGFLIIMVLAGGLVALIADRLGRTLGKKRLTLLGMRPRHTATAITVVAGMLIPFITVLFLAAVSKDVRDWIVQGRDALRQRDEARQQASDLRSENDRITVQIGENKKELINQKALLADAVSQNQEARKELQRIRSEVVRLTIEINKNRNEIRRYQSELQAKRVDLANADKRLEELARDLKAKSGELASLRTTYDVVYKQREEANQEYVRVSEEKDQLTKLNTSLRSENEKASADLQKTNAELAIATKALTDAQTQLAVAQSNLNIAGAFYFSNLGRTRFKHQSFQIGDELARITVPSGTDGRTARGLFANLIRQAIATAGAAGAKGSGGQEAANLINRPDEKGVEIPPSQQEEKLVALMTDKKENLVVIATAHFNTFGEEWVPLAIQVYRNPTIYKQNEKVAEVMINGSESEGQIIQHISDFLTQTVKPKALKDRMIPVAGQEEMFGEIPLTKIVELAQEIGKTDRPIRLAAHADADTRAADPLRLHFRWR